MNHPMVVVRQTNSVDQRDHLMSTDILADARPSPCAFPTSAF
jgi:hypothetical protein